MAQISTARIGATPVRGMNRRTWVTVLTGMTVIGMAAEYASGHWDASAHYHGGVDTFWYPPHFGIYAGLLLAAITAVAASVIALSEPLPLGQRIRKNAALLFVAGMNAVNFTGAPFDAWWHTVYGIDLTIWSPPHLHMLAGMILAPIFCTVMFMPLRHFWATLRGITRIELVQLAIWIFSLMALDFTFIEYQMPRTGRLLVERPDWLYPLLLTGLYIFMLALIQRASARIGMATAAATGFFAVRSLITIWLSLSNAYPLAYPQPIIIAALVLDLVLLATLHTPRLKRSVPLVLLGSAAAALAFLLIAPLYAPLIGYPIGIPTVEPWRSHLLPVLVGGTLAGLLGTWAGAFLRSLIPAAPEAVRQQRTAPLY